MRPTLVHRTQVARLRVKSYGFSSVLRRFKLFYACFTVKFILKLLLLKQMIHLDNIASTLNQRLFTLDVRVRISYYYNIDKIDSWRCWFNLAAVNQNIDSTWRILQCQVNVIVQSVSFKEKKIFKEKKRKGEFELVGKIKYVPECICLISTPIQERYLLKSAFGSIRMCINTSYLSRFDWV